MARTTLAVMMVAGLAFSACAQIAPPPTEAPAPTPKYVPPPPAPAAPKAARPSVAQPAAAPTEPYKPWEKDADGKLVPLTEPLWYACLHRDPLVKGPYVERVEWYIARRREQFEKIALDNVDILRKVLSGGALDNFKMDKRGDAAAIMMLVKPLIGTTAIRKDIVDRGVVNKAIIDQASNEYREFQELQLREAEAGVPKGDPKDKEHQQALLAVKTRVLLQLGMDESVFAYQGLLLETASRLDQVLAKIDPAVRAKLAGKVDAVKAAKDRKAILAAMADLVGQIEPDQEREVIKAAVDLRPPAPAAPSQLPPLPEEQAK